MASLCEYLLKKGRITEAQLLQAQSQAEILNLRTGLSAYAFGFLDERDIREILGIQQRTGRKFGEVAISLGRLTPEQLKTILRIQEKYRVTTEEILVTSGVLSQQELEEEQRLFQAVTNV